MRKSKERGIKMKDEHRSKEELINELMELRQQIAGLKKSEAERNQTEEALRTQQEEQKVIFDALPTIIWYFDRDGRIQWGNKFATDSIRLSTDKLLGKTVFDLYPPEQAAKFHADNLEVIKSGKPKFHIIEQYHTASGEKRWAQTDKLPYYDREGTIVGIIVFAVDITEYKKVEEALKESEAKFKALTEMSASIIFIYQGEKLSYVNPAGAAITGYTIDALLQMNFWDIMHLDFRELVRERGLLRQSGETVPNCYEVKILTKSGEERWVNFTGEMIEFKGKPAILGNAFDITDHKKVEEALRESEYLYRTLIEHSLTGIFMIRKDNYVFANEMFCKNTGYSLEKLKSKDPLDLIAYKDRERMREFFEKRLSGEKVPSEYETQIIQKDGAIRDVLIKVTLIMFEEEPTVMGSIIDITKHKKVEKELKESEKRYRQLFENVPVGLYRTTKEGEIIDANPAMVQMLGYPDVESLKAEKIIRVYPNPEDRIQWQRLIERDGVIRDFQKQLRRYDGSLIWIEENTQITPGGAGQQYYEGTFVDITERRRAEQKMAELQEQLYQSQKMEAIGQLAGGVAHDFNNLLTVIKGYSQLSFNELQEDSPVRLNIEEIKQAADRAADLTRQLLAFSRRQVMEVKVLDLNTILQNIDKMLHRLIGEDIELITHLDENLGRVKTDPGQIEQVVLNLVLNARDAMLKGGKLIIETANVELDEEYAHEHITIQPGSYVMLAVSDTGVGMTPEVKERVFEPFFTTKEKGRGTGLGLSTVYGIVKQSGGNIKVYSELGKGTTFKVYLPRVDDPMDVYQMDGTTGEVPRGRETILVVEDEEAVRKVATKILERLGYHVLEARHWSEAIHLTLQYKELIHLILTDVVLPEIDGPSLIEKLKEIHQGVKVLYMSGYPGDSVIHQSILEKEANFIQKPFSYEGLARKVRKVLDN